MRLRTRGALAAFPLVMALALTGCGGDEKDSGVATVSGGKQTQAAGGDGLTADQRNVKFAECMRKNGVDMEDPKPGEGPRIMVTGGPKQGEVMEKAQQACKQYAPQQNAGPGGDKQAEERGRKFAECMRKNGVENFPDPEPGQRGIKITGEVGKDPDLQTAQQKCQDLLGGPGGGPGGGGRK
ncbi:hypothetical protein [Actinomadura sp. 21ATH]|uniref:hypothetical protein n=1 Tax=Actinomadura sp. 21ATH TaxID=1735444 RepID=UPI0035C10B25